MRQPAALRGAGRTRRRRRRDERGTSLVEFALVLPVFSLLLFGMIDFGMVFGGYISVENQVNAAARAISVGQIGTCTTALCVADTYIKPTLGVSSVTVGVVITENYVEVCAWSALKASTGITAPILDGRSAYAQSRLLLEQSTSLTSGGASCPS